MTEHTDRRECLWAWGETLCTYAAAEGSEYCPQHRKEAKARDGQIIAMTHEGDESASDSDYRLTIPDGGEFLTPLLLTIPLQLLAYYAALQRGCDVDKPRNLAKSVTVE